MMGALSENGPCFVNDDSNSTRLNPWSWNNEVGLDYAVPQDAANPLDRSIFYTLTSLFRSATPTMSLLMSL